MVKVLVFVSKYDEKWVRLFLVVISFDWKSSKLGGSNMPDLGSADSG